jgi:hypothetical protein
MTCSAELRSISGGDLTRGQKKRGTSSPYRCRNRPKHMISLEREMKKRQEGRQAGRGREGAQEHATTLVFEQL